ncbi:MAG: nucleotidyl transferase AbiEii/AbiGii toxin family protein [Endomicrobiia bacterium]|nr:nucleotidyl transferase AbiEii/AbiGii toxin family protein [Endomicrobiia bacterium]
MNNTYYSNLQIREIFHISFLRQFAKKFKPSLYALKGGVNMRLYFKSPRYSEDMDLDVNTVSVVALRDGVMKIITSATFADELRTFGITDVRPPDISKAKQTETTQRFKIHLLTAGGEDLFTKVEFSRRGGGKSVTESIPAEVLRPYKFSPFIISHYDARIAVEQKIGALAGRSVAQARDIFDIHTLSTQYSPDDDIAISSKIRKVAAENALAVGFNQFRDTVLSYLPEDNRMMYDNRDAWDDIKLKVSEIICPQKQR